MLSILSLNLNAQSVTNIDISSTVVQAGVQRLGINMGAHTFYDSGQFTKNLIFRNPGFEPQMYQSTIRCGLGTPISCTDEDAYSAWPAGFWQGASYEVIYGAAKGRTGTIVASTPAVNAVLGAVLTFDSLGTAPQPGDYLIVRQAIPGNPTGGWWASTQGNATFAPETSDLPPGTSGVQSLRVTAQSANDSATIASYFDGTAGLSFLQMNGHFELSFKAKGTHATKVLGITLYRPGGTTYIPGQNIKLTDTWNTYTLDFSASENGSAVGAVNVIFSAPGPTGFLIDDVSLIQTDSSSSNPTQYRDAVVNALKTYAPGALRYWDSQLGESLDNWIAPPFGRKPAGYSAWTTSAEDISVGLHEFLQLCQTTGADPWVVIPVVFSPAEAGNLIEYLSGPATSTYGAKRAARGQSAPWTSVFGQIHLELGNESWNSDFKGGNMEYSDAYGIYSNDVFGAMRANPNFVKSQYDLILGGQEGYTGRNQTIVTYANQQDTLALAGYLSPSVDNFADNEQLFGPLFAEPESDTAPGGVYGQNRSFSTSMATYELNLTTESGAIDQATLNQYTPSLGAGLAVADHMLMMMRDLGVHPINIWQLGQYDLNRKDGKTVPLFGAVVDMGNTDRRRPQFLAAALANQAISGDMVQAVQGGPGPNANPTWNQPLQNGVQLGAAHYIQSYAFASGSNRSVILFNLHRASALQVTFSDVNAPSGAVQVQRLTSANITDTNETTQNVGVTTSQIAGFNPATPYTLPPYSMTVLTWTVSSKSNVSLSVSPNAANVGPGGSQSFSATVSNSANQGVTWSINPSVGSISSSGVYSAPASFTTPQTVNVTATSVADPTRSAAATISLVPLVVVTVLPGSTSVGAGQTKQFTISIQNTSNSAVQWSISPAIGTISSTGLYTAPSLMVVAATVTVTATSMASPTQFGTAALSLTPGSSQGASAPFPPFAVNSGGGAYTDSAGLSWVADIGYTGGSASNTETAISGTADQALYQTQRWGDFTYSFAVPNGTYQIKMKFAEFFFTSPGQRVFNVLVNNKTVLSQFDIVQAAGSNFKAVDSVILANISNGQIVVSFGAVTDSPAINGIELVLVAPPVTVSPAAVTLTPGSTQQFTAKGGLSGSYYWSISPQVGSLSSTGFYTPPSTVTAPQTITLRATNAAKPYGAAWAKINLLPNSSKGATIAINAGGPAYTDSSGLIWSADTSFVGGQVQAVQQAILGTNTPVLYQSNRWGNTTYNEQVLNGTYTVTLKFAELFWNNPGQRVFNVIANGQTVLSNFDIVAAAGAPGTAVDRSFNLNVTNGTVNLQFAAVTDFPLVSAIEITPN